MRNLLPVGLRRHRRRGRLEIGLDEAGRGCLAGPLAVGAVVLAPGRRSPRDLDDSKRLDPARRDELRAWIEESALAWAVAWASPAEIDAENVLQATVSAMHRAVDAVQPRLDAALAEPAWAAYAKTPRALLVDGHYFRPHADLPHDCERGGDGRFQAIAAASILAKTHRDARMRELDAAFPAYAWASNKGYPTPPHQRALRAYGPCAWHRRSFRLEY